MYYDIRKFRLIEESLCSDDPSRVTFRMLLVFEVAECLVDRNI